MGNRIYGCDDCLAVCPWNKFASAAHRHRHFVPREDLTAPDLADLLAVAGPHCGRSNVGEIDRHQRGEATPNLGALDVA